MEEDIHTFKKSMPRIKFRGQAGKDLHPLAHFTIYVTLFTDEVFALKHITPDMKISDLKKYLEFATGIPKHMQRVSYLDEGELLEMTDVRNNDIVTGAMLQLTVWPMWRELIEAAASNDIEWVFKLGVTRPTDYRTPQSDYMTRKACKAWLDERAFLALYIAAHRGHDTLCKKLISAGVDLNTTTKHGRTALHVAAAQGWGNIVDLLLERGANIDAEDEDGKTASAIAAQFGHKNCEQHLFLYRWQQRAKHIKPPAEAPRMAHQYHDSAFPVWLSGTQCQTYVSNILPPGEFEGTGLGARPKRRHPAIFARDEHLINNVQGHETYDFDEEFDDERTDRLPMLKEEKLISKSIGSLLHGGEQRRSRRGQKCSSSYDEWLTSKKTKEQSIINIKKREDERKRVEVEDRKAYATQKSQSYEMWLAQKSVDKPRKSITQSDDGFSQEKKPGYLRSYLESLKQRKRGNGYEEWLVQKELEMLDQAMEGYPLITC